MRWTENPVGMVCSYAPMGSNPILSALGLSTNTFIPLWYHAMPNSAIYRHAIDYQSTLVSETYQHDFPRIT